MSIVLALVDLTGYSLPVVKAAYNWCILSDAELHILHKAEPIFPGFMDPEIKEKWGDEVKENVISEINEFLNEVITIKLPRNQIHVTTQRLLPYFSQIIAQHKVDIVFAGVKSKDYITGIFIGNTVLKLIDNFPVPIAVIPKQYIPETPFDLYVAITPECAFSIYALKRLTDAMVLRSIQFISVSEPGVDSDAYISYIREMASHFPKIKTSYKLLEGTDVYSQLKILMDTHKSSLLVVQRGKRDFEDMIYRKFTVNQLINDANIPLIVFP